MKNTLIRLNSPEAVQEFVNAAVKCNFDIDAKHNRVIVDAKSFLGVLGLSVNPISVYTHGEDAAFEETLEKFAVC
ncbi:MAG: HPr family phosphocarrier protein [Lachnospiraceae bacterium]|nr:HPr family phosphocarrier protein [Lachnospiraceae bacterium]